MKQCLSYALTYTVWVKIQPLKNSLALPHTWRRRLPLEMTWLVLSLFLQTFNIHTFQWPWQKPQWLTSQHEAHICSGNHWNALYRRYDIQPPNVNVILLKICAMPNRFQCQGQKRFQTICVICHKVSDKCYFSWRVWVERKLKHHVENIF